ncbi:hypothetical protein B0H12DRAFT_1243632 [Mycena haematopus]|nr:hypothetical protein B0H12DRAFT_1243632 [Mycena haematopus]
MEPGSIFPQEIFDIIIDFCEDFETLRSCALVSASFYHRTRLFCRIRVGPLDEEHTIEALEQFLEDSPSSAACVKSLHLWDRDNSWMSETSSARFLSLLVSVTDIRMSGSFSFDWVDAIPLCRSIRLALTRPTLTSLELTGFHCIPLTVLAHCPALRSLTLTWVRFDPNNHNNFDAAVAACADSSPAQLEALSCALEPYTFALLVRWILRPQSTLNVSCLHSLVYTAHKLHETAVIQRLLDASAQSLRHLRLNNVVFPPTHVLDLSQIAHLHLLSVGISQGIAPPSRVLNLDLAVYTWDVHRDVVPLLADVDGALAAFTFIKNVTILISLTDPELRGSKLVDVSGIFMQEMPLLAECLAKRGNRLVVQQSPLVTG